MILFHAKANGQVTTTPSLVPQGSSMQDLVVLSEFDYALCTIRLEPATGVYISDIICDFVETDNQKTLWVANMPPEATKLNGQVNYQLEFTAADGTTMPTLSGTFRVSKGVISNMPETVANLQSYTIGQIYTLLSNIYGKVVEMASDGGGTIYVDVSETGTSNLSGKTIVGHVKAGRNVIARYGGMNYSYFSDISEEVAVFRLTVSGGIRATVDAVETESIIIRGNNAVVSRELFEGKSSASGTFVIPPTEWTDSTPSSAQIILGVNVFTAGCVVLIIPENDATKAAAEAARMSMVVNQTGDFDAPTPDSVMIARAEGGTVPTIPLNFRYVVLKTGSTDKALVAMVGVDAVGAGGTGGTGGSGGGVDEVAVRSIINQVVPEWARKDTPPEDAVKSVNGKKGDVNIPIPEVSKNAVGLGNVANERQYSEANPPPYPVKSVNGKTGAVSLGASDVGARPSTWTPTAEQVGADPAGTAATKVSDHDTYTGSHNDIRLLIKGLSDRLNALANSDDTTLDDLKEIVTYIKANKALIDSITTSKVSVTDIINNLTTNVTNQPLSAAQGVALKKLIDALSTGKLDASALNAAITQALAEAKESGEFKGDPGSSVSIKSISESTASGGDNVVTFSDGKTLTVKNGKDGVDTVNICLPSKDIAVVGREYNIYKDSIIFGNRPYTDYDIAMYLNDSTVQTYTYHEVFRFVPAKVGTYTLTVYIRDYHGTELTTKTMTIEVVANAETEGKNVLFIGDSLTAAGIYSAEIQHNLSAGGITSVGTIETTRTIEGVSRTSKHEGRNGWATWDYAGTKSDSLSKFNSASNVFRNPSTNKFDLAYYMNTYHSGVTLHAVCINLGTNGIGADTSVMNGLNELVTRIKEYDSALPILIHLTIPEARQDYRADRSGGKNTTHYHMRRCWLSQVTSYMNAYDGKVDNVYVVPVYCNMDIVYDFPTEEVAVSTRNPEKIYRASDGHPNTYGYLKMADVYYAHLLKYMREGGETVDTYYTVTNNLTNVTNSNTATSVKKGEAYSATLTANSGYTLNTVAVTMGGTAVEVTNGVINIASVTGNIIITATANVADSGYTNLAKPSTANDSAPNTALTADEWLNGYYISSKNISAKDDLVVTNRIPLTLTDTIRIKGFAVTGTIGGSNCAGRFRVLSCDSSGNALATEIKPAIANATDGVGRLEIMDTTELENGVYCWSPSNDNGSKPLLNNVAFVRICGYPIDGDNANVIVTVNEPIA